MRNREKYQILKNATDDNWHLIVQGDMSHNGQSFMIRNALTLFPAIGIIKDLNLYEMQDEEFKKDIEDKIKNNNSNLVSIPNHYYDYLIDWINHINNNVSLVANVLSTTFKEQDQYTISIKISREQIKNLDDLNKFNKEITDTLDKFILKRYKGSFELGGFDTGTDWIDIVISGLKETERLSAYAGVLGIILIAQQSMELRTKYYESETTKIQYLSAKQQLEKKKDLKLSDIDDKDIKLYINNLVSNEVRSQIEKLCIETGLNNNEDANSFEKAIPTLEKHMKEGVEYHSSINSPEKIVENDKKQINYDNLKKFIEKKKEEELAEKEKVKTIENKNKEQEDSKDE